MNAGIVLHYASRFPTFLPLNMVCEAFALFEAHGEPLRFTCGGPHILLEWSPIFPGTGDGPRWFIPHPWAGEKGTPVRIEWRKPL